jgi:hypothetical protein
VELGGRSPELTSTTSTWTELPISRRHGIYVAVQGVLPTCTFFSSSQFKLTVTRSDSGSLRSVHSLQNNSRDSNTPTS